MTEMKSRVNLDSKLTVVSSKPTGPGKTQKLTSLDHAMGQHTLHLVFYYRVNPFKDGPFESDLDNLRVTLSDLLCLYPKVTGRLGRSEGEDGNWEVKCNDAGLRTLRASVGTTLDEWLRSADVSEERDLTVWEDMPEDPSIWSPFRIQFNDFEGGGLAIGFSFTHLHADLSSAILLLKSWAEVYRGEPIKHLPIFELPARPSSKVGIEPTEYLKRESKISETKAQKIMSTITFKFSDLTIKENLLKINDKYCPNATPFEFLLALFWMRILQNSDAHNHTHSVSVCIDMRNRVNSPIPQGYFGNALHFSSLSVDSNALESCTFDLGDMVSVVHGDMTCLKNEEFFSGIDWLESRKGESGKYEPPFKMYGPELTFISMENMIGGTEDADLSMYSVSFRKDEKPVHVSCRIGNVEGEGLILVMPSPEGGLSRTVTVTLPEDDIDRLCGDQIIASMKPVMIMSGCRL